MFIFSFSTASISFFGCSFPFPAGFPFSFLFATAASLNCTFFYVVFMGAFVRSVSICGFCITFSPLDYLALLSMGRAPELSVFVKEADFFPPALGSALVSRLLAKGLPVFLSMTDEEGLTGPA